ncbi:MAG: AraC family transcriptional regulator [Tannerellaceae bacterium]|nr:AraC family transcriptional regulator [Tannerellaceae bacterium]
MNNLPLIELSELTDHISISGNYRDTIILANISYIQDFNDFSDPVRLNIPIVALILQGSIKINLDYVSYTVSANYLITVMPTHVVQIAEMSTDLKAHLLILDRAFIEDCKLDKRSPSMLNYIQFRKKPCTLLSSEEAAHIEQCFASLEQKIKLRTHAFHLEVVQNAVIAFLLELANVLVGKREVIPRLAFSRKEEIMNRFLQLLLTHISERHVVTFYAEKLCISSQYLSLVLKELTGKPANKWIDEALIVEAKVLLKSPQTTIQQVADTLNFSDQSTFGKFFKKHTGVSPTEYRKS